MSKPLEAVKCCIVSNVTVLVEITSLLLCGLVDLIWIWHWLPAFCESVLTSAPGGLGVSTLRMTLTMKYGNRWGRNPVKFMYENRLLSHLAANQIPQQGNNASSMPQRCCWILQMNHPMLPRPSNPVWGINVFIEYYEVRVRPIAHDLTELTTPGMQRHRREPQRPCPMAHRAEGWYGDNQRRRKSPGSGPGETPRATDKVPITHLSSYQLASAPSARSLEGIEKRSRGLWEKVKGARILDEMRDPGTIIKPVGELRRTILLYCGSALGVLTGEIW